MFNSLERQFPGRAHLVHPGEQFLPVKIVSHPASSLGAFVYFLETLSSPRGWNT